MQLRKRKKSRLLQTFKEKKKQKNQLSILLIRHTEKHNNNNNNNPTKDSIFCSNPCSKTGTKLKVYLAASTLLKLFGSPWWVDYNRIENPGRCNDDRRGVF
jgi:hypothetical protein